MSEHHNEHSEHEHEEHITSYGLNIGIYFILVFFTAVTIGVSYIDLAPALSVVAILGIASIKGTFVLLYFMHLLYEKPVFRYMFISTLFTYIIFLILTFADTIFRY